MEEMRERLVGMMSIQAEIKSKVFEDNLYANHIAKDLTKSKYINSIYWHFM